MRRRPPEQLLRHHACKINKALLEYSQAAMERNLEALQSLMELRAVQAVLDDPAVLARGLSDGDSD